MAVDLAAQDAHLLGGTFSFPRFYLPREDVLVPLERHDGLVTTCAYKGHATYWDAPGLESIAWSYEEPLPDAEQVRGLVCFFTAKLDLALDGVRQERPCTPWA